MVAQRHRVGARAEKIVADRLGDAKTAGGVLAVDDDEIERPTTAQLRQTIQQDRAARAPHDVTDQQHAHQEGLAAISSRSVSTKSSRWSCGPAGTFGASQAEYATPTAIARALERSSARERS